MTRLGMLTLPSKSDLGSMTYAMQRIGGALTSWVTGFGRVQLVRPLIVFPVIASWLPTFARG
jgi:hypothetical protein